MSELNLRQHFEANMLDGDKVEDCGGTMIAASEVWDYIKSLPSNLEPLDSEKVYGEQYLVKDDVKQPLYSCRASLLVAKISKELNIADWVVRKKCLGLIQEFFDAIINQYYLFSPAQFGRKEVTNDAMSNLVDLLENRIVELNRELLDCKKEVPLRLPERDKILDAVFSVNIPLHQSDKEAWVDVNLYKMEMEKAVDKLLNGGENARD